MSLPKEMENQYFLLADIILISSAADKNWTIVLSEEK